MKPLPTCIPPLLPLLLLLLLLAACAPNTPTIHITETPRSESTPQSETSPRSESTTATNSPADWSALILAITKEHAHYARAADQSRWAPYLPTPPAPARMQHSGAPADSPHGNTLYLISARDIDSYNRLPWRAADATSPIGQAVVLQTFTPVEVPASQSNTVQHNGILYKPGPPGDLFIMTKLDPDTPGTDRGWIYAITDHRGQIIRAAGPIASCIACHQSAPRDRLFVAAGR